MLQIEDFMEIQKLHHNGLSVSVTPRRMTVTIRALKTAAE